MFRAISCSSSGGQIVLIQHMVSSLSVSDRPVHNLYHINFMNIRPVGDELFHADRRKSTHSPPGATNHAGSWPTQEVASNHLYPWPWSSNFWLPASLHPSSLHPSVRGLAFPLAFCPPARPRWFSYMVDYLAFVLYVLSIWAWLS